MIQGTDTIIFCEDDVLDLTGDDILSSTEDIFSFDNNDTISLTDWVSPLSTSLSSGLTYSAYPATTVNVSSGSTGGTLSTSSGSSGATLSTTLNNGLMWNNTPYTATASGTVNSWTTYNQPQVLRVSGDAEFEGEIKVKGVNLTERLDAIEERLGILRPNNDLEGKWEKLKKLGDEYRKLEQEILEGENIWDMLKK